MVDSDVDAMLAEVKGQRDRFQRTWDAVSATLGPGRVEVDTLAHQLAYRFAVALLDGECLRCDLGGVDPHFDLREEGVQPDVLEDFRASVRYLEVRGLLARDPDQPHLAQVLDESEATA